MAEHARGRIPGVPNRDKAELRALIQERVHEFTQLRRAADIAAGVAPEDAQPIIEDYDPVVQMSLFAADRRVKTDLQLRAASEVAQYVRPRLKSIEMTMDPEGMESLVQRQELSHRLVGLLEMAAAARKTSDTPPPATPPAGDD